MLIAACLAISCQRKETRATDRLAVLPLENLTSDASLDWIGVVASRVMGDQLTASLKIRPFDAADMRTARLSNASQVVQGYYTRVGDRLILRAVLRDAGRNTNLQWMEWQGSVPGVVLPAAEWFAKQIDKRTRPFGTQNTAALRAWGEALSATEPARQAAALETAITADPNWGVPYLQLTQVYGGMGDRDRTLDVLRRADERLNQFTDLDRARVELLEGGLRQNPEQRRRALTAISRLVSTDLDTLRALAEAEMQARRFPAAVELLKNALAMEPDNAGLLNQLGYLESYNGNLAGARQALERYRGLDPKGVNPLDSLGEVHFMAGKFAEAEKYFMEAAALRMGPATGVQVLKAAQSRALQGNLAGADELYGRFEQMVKSAGDATVEIRRAQWLYVTGRKPQGLAQAEAAARVPDADASAYARLQLGFWKLGGGDTAGAAQLAGLAAAGSRNAAVQRSAALLRAAAGDETAPGLDGNAAALAQGYRLAFTKEFAKALPVFAEIYKRLPPVNDGEARTMYALSLAMVGRKDEARPLVARYFIPLGSGDDPVSATLTFPYLVELRASLGVSR